MNIEELNDIIIKLQNEIKSLETDFVIFAFFVGGALIIYFGYLLSSAITEFKETKQKEHDAKLKKDIFNDIVDYYDSTKGDE